MVVVVVSVMAPVVVLHGVGLRHVDRAVVVAVVVVVVVAVMEGHAVKYDKLFFVLDKKARVFQCSSVGKYSRSFLLNGELETIVRVFLRR